ncbi:MAG TPA: precorrin-6y C5,15-methyltransferase (decarboxylating) subunit CbiE [Anaerovoracaceae bacterium]|nr:precorrin-6y C5,15-methyltransferase (decarboxylating) subunit CbiE [Anaerovoracaceae bacterium]
MKKIYLVGIGMGNIETLTEQGRKAIEASELLIGAERMVNAFPDYQGEVCYAISPVKIMDYILEHPEPEIISVIFSGDVGFYSGAKKLNQLIEEQKQSQFIGPDPAGSLWNDYAVEFIPGISSLQYFSAKLKLPWEDTKIVSLHGREDNIMGAVWNHKKIFFLTGGDYSVRKVCQILSENNLKEAIVHVGERLSYPNERIVSATAGSLAKEEFDPLAVMLVENEKIIQRSVITHGIKDELFLRGQVPMTKSEIRSISLSKLQLRPWDVVYDIGAGTGSVSIEMAFQAYEGSVYAVEFNEEALGLIRENAEQFGVWNLKVIEGKAPEALAELPAPDRAFIGGSKGNLAEILELLIQKNPGIRVVINAITLETMTEAVSQFQKLGFEDIDIVQIFAAHSKAAGNYHMMQGQNPVFIISGEMKSNIE